MIPVPKLGIRAILEISITVALVAALVAQTVRIDGLALWPLHITGLKSELQTSRQHTAETKAAFDQTVAGYRAAAAQARAEDAANASRVKAEQSAINRRSADEYPTRIAAARADAQRLRHHAAAAADSGAGGAAPMPGLPAPAQRTAQAAGQDGLSDTDQLIATEQAIQLDELIKWVRQQHAVDSNALAPADAGAGQSR